MCMYVCCVLGYHNLSGQTVLIRVGWPVYLEVGRTWQGRSGVSKYGSGNFVNDFYAPYVYL